MPVGIVRGSEPLDFSRESSIHSFSPFLAGFRFGPKSTEGGGGLIRFAEGDVKTHDFRTLVAYHVERFGEVGAGEWPTPQDFLRTLVYINHNDPRIRM